jgi:hypothetical protein
VRDLTQVAGDRIAALTLRSAAGEARTLIAELVGRHANLVLLARRTASCTCSSPRRRQGGSAPRHGQALRAAAGSCGRHVRTGRFPRCFPRPQRPRRCRAARREPRAALVDRRARARRTGRRGAPNDLARRVDRAGRTQAEERALDAARPRAPARASANAERVRQDGELVKATCRASRAAAASIEVEDLFDPSSRSREGSCSIPRSRRTRTSRALRARQEARARRATRSRARSRWPRRASPDLERSSRRPRADDADLEALEQAAVASGLLEAPQATPEHRKEKPQPRLPYRNLPGLRRHGDPRRPHGQGQRRPDVPPRARQRRLVAHGDAPGSHVVLPVHKGEEPHPGSCSTAAHLAVAVLAARRPRRAGARARRPPQGGPQSPRGAKTGPRGPSPGAAYLVLRLQPERLQRSYCARTIRAPAGRVGYGFLSVMNRMNSPSKPLPRIAPTALGRPSCSSAWRPAVHLVPEGERDETLPRDSNHEHGRVLLPARRPRPARSGQAIQGARDRSRQTFKLKLILPRGWSLQRARPHG